MAENREHKILIIDNNHEGLDIILSSFGYETFVAENGSDGLEFIKNNINELDIILLELILPGLPGWKILEEVRGNPETKALPIIVITSFHSKDNQVSCLKLGADDYLVKPFEILNLIARIESVLRRISWHSTQRFTISLDEDVFDGSEKLTGRQVEILALMSKGYSNKEMATRLYLSETTIKAHLRSIFKKLKVSNRTQAVLAGMDLGLLA